MFVSPANSARVHLKCTVQAEKSTKSAKKKKNRKRKMHKMPTQETQSNFPLISRKFMDGRTI